MEIIAGPSMTQNAHTPRLRGARWIGNTRIYNMYHDLPQTIPKKTSCHSSGLVFDLRPQLRRGVTWLIFTTSPKIFMLRLIHTANLDAVTTDPEAPCRKVADLVLPVFLFVQRGQKDPDMPGLPSNDGKTLLIDAVHAPVTDSASLGQRPPHVGSRCALRAKRLFSSSSARRPATRSPAP